MRSANLIPTVRIYGHNAQQIALRYRDRQTERSKLGIVVWRVAFKDKSK